jgi:ribulose 1,5-bisphosphate synthetase/thiazole synthase
MPDYRSLSLWFDQLDEPLTPRASLPGDVDVDVAIVGAGFTGLWTAYYLQALDPNRSIALVEAEIAGFGASGRRRSNAYHLRTVANLVQTSGHPEGVPSFLEELCRVLEERS